MVQLDLIDTTFMQPGNSCVLASYAIVGNYFTRISTHEIFKGYFGHFRLKYTMDELGSVYEKHFFSELESRRCNGYELITDLHNKSPEKAFTSCRFMFSAEFYRDSEPFLADFENILKNTESLLNITYVIPQENNCHSITVFYSTQGLAYRNTLEENIKKLGTLESIRDFGKLNDAVVYRRIAPDRSI